MKTAALLLAFTATVGSHAAELVSAFAGSELIGEFSTDFDRFHYLVASESGIEAIATEGRISSRMFRKPTEKSTYEVFRSYEKELQAAGFEMLASIGDKPRDVQRFSRQINKGDGSNALTDRTYQLDGKGAGGGDLDWLATFAEHYIAARKVEGGAETLVVVLIADRRDLYAVDILESAAMEDDTVALSLDALRAQMTSEGRIALYGILFDTGSANLRAESQSALDVIATYLRENPNRSFYVVGHTDDAGNLASNMQLSSARAASTVDALVEKAPGAKARLLAHGVGPLSPVATNADGDGRQLNRRVELVSKVQ